MIDKIVLIKYCLEHNIRSFRRNLNNNLVTAEDSCAFDIVEYLATKKKITKSDRDYINGFIHGMEFALRVCEHQLGKPSGKRKIEDSQQLHKDLVNEYNSGRVLNCKKRPYAWKYK